MSKPPKAAEKNIIVGREHFGLDVGRRTGENALHCRRFDLEHIQLVVCSELEPFHDTISRIEHDQQNTGKKKKVFSTNFPNRFWRCQGRRRVQFLA